MKKLIITSILAVLTALATTVGAQRHHEEYLGLPGDNLNLYAVMELFRNSPTLEAFERRLNDRNSRINNLDLNGDYRVDYLAVSDYRRGKVHTIVLRAVLGRHEYQDVAVIIVERLRRRQVMIQIIGDEALYGKNYIIEPVYARKNRAFYYSDPFYYGDVTIINNVWYDPWDWPVIVHIYSPHYTVWRSSWYWGYYPDWYEPWRPYYWHFYYGYHSGWNNHYNTWYRHCDYPRNRYYNDFYYHGIRQQSPQVHHRIAEGTYRNTYSRPDQRSAGEELNTRMRTSVSTGTRTSTSDVPVRRREAASEAVRKEAPAVDTRNAEVRDAGRRSAETTTVETRAAEVRDAERRSAAAVAGETRAAEVRDAERRSSEARAEEARAAQAREAERRAAEARDAEMREAQNRAAEARAAEARAAQARESERRMSEARAEEVRAAQAREAERRAAEARDAEMREAQNRAAEAKAAEARAAQARESERRMSEARAEEVRAAQAREAERRAAEARAAETRTAESRRNEAPESRSVSENRTARPNPR